MIISSDAFRMLTPSEVNRRLNAVELELLALTEATSNTGSDAVPPLSTGVVVPLFALAD
jgi:hypothetical protein